MYQGLTSEQVNDPQRLERYSTNKREAVKGVTYWELIWIGMHDLTIILLTISSIISIILGIYTHGIQTGWFDGFAIIVTILVCLNVSAINDLQKDKQFRALNAENNKSNITVIRDSVKSKFLWMIWLWEISFKLQRETQFLLMVIISLVTM